MTAHQRQAEIIGRIARQAMEQPRLDSGLWYHNDIRNNYYFASYLIAVAVDSNIDTGIDRASALKLGTDVLLRVLALQMRDPQHALYGHWPLGLNPSPEEAAPNPLPAELMGCLIACFYDRYGKQLSPQLCAEFENALHTLYRSSYYRVPQMHYGHHESKYIATKLIFGSRFGDAELLEEGAHDLRKTIARLKEKGMPEYGALPWFWHWVQAFTCAYACVADAHIRALIGELLDELWFVRAQHYLGGAWVGARMRSLATDLPADRNILFDYVQFGDFRLPAELPRVEYAGLLYYEAPAEARRAALEREEPIELSQVVAPWPPDAEPLHKYTYITKAYAIGGMLERVKEFDNEQHRWDIAFPLTEDGNINHLYIFQPGERHNDGDPRHQSDNGAVLFRKNALAALYASAAPGERKLTGVLPKGEWMRREKALFGYIYGVYAALFLYSEYELTEQADRCVLSSDGMPSGVVVQLLSTEEAASYEVAGLADFARLMAAHAPVWSCAEDGRLSVAYDAAGGERLQLSE